MPSFYHEDFFIMKFSSLQECPPPLEAKCVVRVTALELPTGEDLTRYTRHLSLLSRSPKDLYRVLIMRRFFLPYFSVVTEAADANQPEDKKEDEDTSTGSS